MKLRWIGAERVVLGCMRKPGEVYDFPEGPGQNILASGRGELVGSSPTVKQPVLSSDDEDTSANVDEPEGDEE